MCQHKETFSFVFSDQALLLGKIKTIWNGILENDGSVLRKEHDVTSRSRLKCVSNKQTKKEKTRNLETHSLISFSAL